MINGTICGKHDEIDSLADKIRHLAEQAKEDGIRMEAGLDEKRRSIEELEKEVKGLKDDVSVLENKVTGLEDDVSELEAQLSNVLT